MLELNKSSNQLLHGRVARSLEHFVSSGSADVRVVAECIRVMVAHGTFTAAMFKFGGAAGRRAVDDLSELLLNAAERKFNAWLVAKIQGEHGIVER